MEMTMKKKDLEAAVKELEEWVRSISCIQTSLVKELGYEVKWRRNEYIPKAWVEKINKEP